MMKSTLYTAHDHMYNVAPVPSVTGTGSMCYGAVCPTCEACGSRVACPMSSLMDRTERRVRV